MIRAGQLTGEDAQAAFRLLAKAAKAGVPAALYQVGRAYLLGQGVPSSAASALHWLNKAAEADDVDAQLLLASLALQGVRQNASSSLFDTAEDDLDRKPDHRAALCFAEQAVNHGSL